MKNKLGYKVFKDNTDTSLITSRKAYAIVDNKHDLCFHKDGHILIFYTRRIAQHYLESNKFAEYWRVKRIKLEVSKDYK